jgi:hypothetical protein
VTQVRFAVRRAEEAEALASETRPGRKRDMLEEIARLWREFAQHDLLDDLLVRRGD